MKKQLLILLLAVLSLGAGDPETKTIRHYSNQTVIFEYRSRTNWVDWKESNFEMGSTVDETFITFMHGGKTNTVIFESSTNNHSRYVRYYKLKQEKEYTGIEDSWIAKTNFIYTNLTFRFH